MGIKMTYMVPHPPLIVPDVGKGSEKKVLETINAYERVGWEISKIAPDTIIIVSPHSVMYSDYFHISPGERAQGNFGSFGAPEVKFDEEYDTEFVELLESYLKADGFPGGTDGERDKDLDHGTMVPLHFVRKYSNKGKIVRIGLSGLPLTEHYRLGMYIKKTAEALGRNAVLIASGDLSHKLQLYGPYGFDPAGPVYDEKIMEAASLADFKGMLEFDEDLLDSAAECGHRSFVIMAGALDGVDVKPEVLSYQDVTGVGYGICIFEPLGSDDKRCFLDEAETDFSAYVKLARTAVETFVESGKRLKFPDNIPDELLRELPPEAISDRAGVFVSVHKNGGLRGCIGTIGPVQDSIAEEIISNAISAVSRDPRFDPVEPDELPYLDINVDVLSKPEPVDDPSKLDVRRYGVIVTCGARRGLLLPDLEGIDTVEEQISIAMQKGGISPLDDYSLQRFEVIRYW